MANDPNTYYAKPNEVIDDVMSLICKIDECPPLTSNAIVGKTNS
jgi:hypothetical protein